MEDIVKLAEKANQLFAQEKYKEALSYYLSALALDADNSISHCNLGIVYEMLQENELAVAFYKKAIRLDEKNIRAVNNLARIYIDIVGDFEIAAEYLDWAIKTEPNDAEAYNLYGNLSLKKKDYTLAKDYFKKSIFLDSEFFKNYYDLALAYKGLNKKKEAKEALNKCLELQNNFKPAIELNKSLN